MLSYEKGFLSIKKSLFTKKKKKKFPHTEKRFVYIQINPRQIAGANSHSKKPRQIAGANPHGKQLQLIPTANSHSIFPGQLTTATICEGVPILLTHVILTYVK